jgi:hypothetical protein
MVVAKLDGMDPIEACYSLAGQIGIHPSGLTFRQLWMMADGKARSRRIAMVEQADLVWPSSDYDLVAYTEWGKMESSNIGKPVEYSPEMESAIQQEIARQAAMGELPNLQVGANG